MPGVPEPVRALSLMVWSQIFGCISFELFGHYKGSVRTRIDSSRSSWTRPPTWCCPRVSERDDVRLVYPLETERLIIRALTPDDLDRHHLLFSNPDVVRYLYFGPFDRDAAYDHLLRRSTVDLPGETEWINFGVEVKGEGVLIGELAMGFISATHEHYEVGYVFDPAYAGRGYATEGTAMIVELAFSALGAHRVSGRLDARNVASARVLEKLGMRREAHFLENEFVKGEWTDELAYAVLAPEWRALRGPATEFQLLERVR